MDILTQERVLSVLKNRIKGIFKRKKIFTYRFINDNIKLIKNHLGDLISK